MWYVDQNRGISKEFELKIKNLKKGGIIYDFQSNYIVCAHNDKKLVRFIASTHPPINFEKEKKQKR